MLTVVFVHIVCNVISDSNLLVSTMFLSVIISQLSYTVFWDGTMAGFVLVLKLFKSSLGLLYVFKGV